MATQNIDTTSSPGSGAQKPTPPSKITQKGITDVVNPKKTSLPNSRQSAPNDPHISSFIGNGAYRLVTPTFLREVIPIMRQLMMWNGDVGQAIHNIVTLGNTGHKVFFDRNVPQDQVDSMRDHLNNQRTKWASGQAGMDGVVNRLFTQCLVGGALSGEWVPNKDLTGIETIILVNPEDIEFVLDQRGTCYYPYQRVRNWNLINSTIKPQPPATPKGVPTGLIPLNPNTYQYYALNGDGEVPYGFPPYMAAIPRIKSQSSMDKNIDYVIDQMGLTGFLEALLQKPDQLEEETEDAYMSRLDRLLGFAKERLKGGFKDGLVVGFADDHKFDFHGATKSYEYALRMYENNELMLGSALKQDMSLLGRGYSTSETQITVVFVKMLSELKNMQNMVKSFLEFGYALELRLAGYTFNSLNVKFNRSTIQDELKSQQADEIKIRNVQTKMILGLINQNQAADELGEEAPAFAQPQVPWEVLAGIAPPGTPAAVGTPDKGAAKKKAVKDGKNKSAKTGRDKNTPMPK